MRSVVAALALATVAVPALAGPSPDFVLSGNRLATAGNAWYGKAAFRSEYAYSGQGMTGKVGTLADLSSGHFVDTYAIGPATGAQGFDGTHTWAKDQSGTVTIQDGGDALPLAINEAYRDANLWWRKDHGGAAIASEGQKTDAGMTYDVLSVTPKGGEPFEAWFDAKTHMLARVKEMQGSAPTTTFYSDYRPIDGVMVPGKIVVSTGDPKYDQTQTLVSASFPAAPEPSAFVVPKVSVMDFSIADGAKETTFRFQLVNNHIYADVEVNGKGPYNFIFDTGGNNILSPSLVRELGLKSEGHIESRGAGSGTMDSGFVKVSNIRIGNAELRSQLFFSVPLDTMANVEGRPEPGMIGFETFRRFVTRIDYGSHTITLIDPKSFDPVGAGTAIPITFDGNVPEAVASYDGIEGKFMVDTGARTALTLTKPFAEKNHLRGDAKGIEATTGWGVGGPTRAFVERGGTLKIGPVEVDHPLTELSTDTGGAMAEGNLAGNIGGGVLKQFVITLDYAHATMYLKPVQGPVADLDTFDRAGMWINADPSGFKVVDVSKDTPAADAGLRAGDIITSVDGKPATSVSLADLRYQLRNDPVGKSITFGVRRDGSSKDVSVKLRDLI